jgi:hypothetical protein
MSAPEDRRRKTPADRFRKILSAESEKPQLGEARKQPVLNLPKAASFRAVEPPPTARRVPFAYGAPRLAGDRFLRTFWTIASSVSVAVNILLLLAVITIVRDLGLLGGASSSSGVLGGLYTNFERMDQAHIRTTIPLQTSIPIDLSVPVQTTTNITLAQDVVIQGAHVRINTALFNIDAPASVTLPAGTALNVMLNMNLPVQGEVPVSLNVPVDIALQDTELHPAIVGLQDTIKPLYCIVDPAARTVNGDPVCR